MRAIGVCNFESAHFERLIAGSDVVPAVNQIERHPFFTQSAACAADRRHGIVTQAWSPIGGIRRYAEGKGVDQLTHPFVVATTEAHGRTPARVILPWQLQGGVGVIAKSINPARIAENFALFDFVLSDEEMATIDRLDTGRRDDSEPDDSARFRSVPEG